MKEKNMNEIALKLEKFFEESEFDTLRGEIIKNSNLSKFILDEIKDLNDKGVDIFVEYNFAAGFIFCLYKEYPKIKQSKILMIFE